MTEELTVRGVIYTSNGLNFNVNGKPYMVSRQHKYYNDIKKALDNADVQKAIDLADMKQGLRNYTNGLVSVEGETVTYDGRPLNHALVRHLLKMYDAGEKIDPFVKFIEKLMQNPSYTAVQELYLFLDSGNFAIADDGDILAYKNVRHDFKDHHTGTFDNSPGSAPEMPRNEVDDNRDVTCSKGLHFCSFDYLRFYGGGGRTIIVKVNPRDVVSIPSDHQNRKARCCRYEVIDEWKPKSNKEAFKDKPVKNVVERWVSLLFDTACDILGKDRGAIRKRCSRGSSAYWVDQDKEIIKVKVPKEQEVPEEWFEMTVSDACDEFEKDRGAILKRCSRGATMRWKDRDNDIIEVKLSEFQV